MTELTLHDQAVEAELAYVNLRGHQHNLAKLVEQKKRNPDEMVLVNSRLPASKAVAHTLQWLATNPRAKDLREALLQPDNKQEGKR